MPKLTIDVEMRLAQLLDGLQQVERSAQQTSKQVTSAFSGLGAAFQSLRALATTGIIGGFFTGAVKAAIEAESASKRLEATLRATGNAAGFTKDQIDKLADSMADTTTFDDESIRNAASEIAKFGTITDAAFTRSLKAAADWAAFTGQNIPEAAKQIGVAISGADAGLGRLERQLGGLTYAEEQFIKSLQDSGDLLGAQNEKLRIIESRVGGLAAAMTQGLGGAAKDVNKQFNEMLEGFGKVGTSGGLVERMLRGLAALLRDITAESQGTRTPLRNLAEDAVEALRKVSPAIDIVTRSLVALQVVRQGSRDGPTVSGKIKDPGKEEAAAEAGAQAARIRAEMDAQLRMGDKLTEQQEKDARDRATKNAGELAKLKEDARKKDIEGTADYLNAIYEQHEANAVAVAKIEQDKWKEIDTLRARALANEEAAAIARHDLLEQGRIDEGQAELSKILKDRADEASRLKNVARDLGFTFSSMFEDAIVSGRKFSEVLKGIGQDLLRIAARKLVTEPLAGAITGLPWAQIIAGLLPKAATGTDFVPRDMPMFLHKGEEVVPAPWTGRNNSAGDVNININVDASGSTGDPAQSGRIMGAAISDAVRREIMTQKRAGGLLA